MRYVGARFTLKNHFMYDRWNGILRQYHPNTGGFTGEWEVEFEYISRMKIFINPIYDPFGELIYNPSVAPLP